RPLKSQMESQNAAGTQSLEGGKDEVKKRMEKGETLKGNGRQKEAIEQYMIALKKSTKREDRLRILDALIESNAYQGNRYEAKQLIKQYDELTTTPEEIHLAQYTSAWSLLQLYRSTNGEEIRSAKRRAIRAMTFLETNRELVEKCLPPHETMKQRERNLAMTLAEIHAILGERNEAEEFIEKARMLASSIAEQLEVLKVEHDFEWIDKVKVAEKMVNLTTGRKQKIDTLLLLDESYLEKESIEDGIETLYRIHHMLRPSSSKSGWEGMAIFAYKLRAVKKRLAECEEEGDREGQFKCEDQLGDLFSDSDYSTQGIDHYEKALKLASTEIEKISALNSLAVLQWELRRYKESCELYQKKKKIEESAAICTTETEVDIAKARICGKLFPSPKELKKEIERLQAIPANRFMNSLYECLSEHYKEQGNFTESTKYKELKERFDASLGEEEDKEGRNQAESFVTFEGMDDKKILLTFADEARAFYQRKVETPSQKGKIGKRRLSIDNSEVLKIDTKKSRRSNAKVDMGNEKRDNGGGEALDIDDCPPMEHESNEEMKEDEEEKKEKK
ncbi:hypothetical protein PFISCL1PPCAC_11397, partial [Pristionchus fissidentatus]